MSIVASFGSLNFFRIQVGGSDSLHADKDLDSVCNLMNDISKIRNEMKIRYSLRRGRLTEYFLITRRLVSFRFVSF